MASTSTTPAIEAHDLHKTFGGTVVALDGVSFAVEQGTVFGLLGPNGAGKTTAVRILTTIINPDAGWGRVLGYDVVHHADTVRPLIGLAGQYAAVDENLTGRENLTMVGRLNHLARDVVARRAVELLEQFGLSDAGDRPLKTYSGGMRRRLDVAAALVARPKVLFLDEPTTGLDPQSRMDVWSMVEGLVGEGTSVLLTTQYLEEADRLAGHIAVVDRGHVIAEGTPAQLKADLGATVLDVGLPDAEAAQRAAVILQTVGAKSPTVVGSIVELPVDDGPRVAMEVLRLLDQHALAPTTFRLREPSLDDVFLALTGQRAEEDGAGPEGAPATEPGSRRRRRRARAAAGTTGDGGGR
ncbi:MAG TPA: ATP-binding cassette domain-containing protein [Acidimicrobiales bacterium]|nr:ATP-binding cassette domain-containing protein [Acidimicrobiales bacterium]